MVARRIVVPVRQLVLASRRIAAGSYQGRAPVTGQDERAELALTFNRMAETVEQTEQRPLELIGCMAHGLRTPLKSMQMMMEGLVDAVLPLVAAGKSNRQIAQELFVLAALARSTGQGAGRAIRHLVRAGNVGWLLDSRSK